MAVPHFDSYEEFFPFYVAAHSKRATRLCHTVSTLTGALVAVAAILARRPVRLLLGPVIGYGGAWASHFLIQRNIPATFGYAAWSLRGDREMIRMILSGRDHELQEIADRYLATTPTEAHPPSLAA